MALDELAFAAPYRLIDPASVQMKFTLVEAVLGRSLLPHLFVHNLEQDYAEAEVCAKTCQTLRIVAPEAYLPMEVGKSKVRLRACFTYGATRTGRSECGPWSAPTSFTQERAIEPDLSALLAALVQANANFMAEGEALHNLALDLQLRVDSCPAVDSLTLARVAALRSVSAATFASQLSLGTALPVDAAPLQRLALGGGEAGVGGAAIELGGAALGRLGRVSRLSQQALMSSFYTFLLLNQVFMSTISGQPLPDLDLATQKSLNDQVVRLKNRDLWSRYLRLAKKTSLLPQDRHLFDQVRREYTERMQNDLKVFDEKLRAGEPLTVAEETRLEQLRKRLPQLTGMDQQEIDRKFAEFQLENQRAQVKSDVKRLQADLDSPNGSLPSKAELRQLAKSAQDLSMGVEAEAIGELEKKRLARAKIFQAQQLEARRARLKIVDPVELRKQMRRVDAPVEASNVRPHLETLQALADDARKLKMELSTLADDVAATSPAKPLLPNSDLAPTASPDKPKAPGELAGGVRSKNDLAPIASSDKPKAPGELAGGARSKILSLGLPALLVVGAGVAVAAGVAVGTQTEESDLQLAAGGEPSTACLAAALAPFNTSLRELNERAQSGRDTRDAILSYFVAEGYQVED